MQAKHLIILALMGMAGLLGFNLINSTLHEKNRAAMDSSVSLDNTKAIDTDTSTNNDIASKPLGEQPKAILDDARAKIAATQDAEQARLTQMEAVQ